MGPGDARAETPRPLRDPTLAVSRPRWFAVTVRRWQASRRAEHVSSGGTGWVVFTRLAFPVAALGLASIRNDFDGRGTGVRGTVRPHAAGGPAGAMRVADSVPAAAPARRRTDQLILFANTLWVKQYGGDRGPGRPAACAVRAC